MCSGRKLTKGSRMWTSSITDISGVVQYRSMVSVTGTLVLIPSIPINYNHGLMPVWEHYSWLCKKKLSHGFHTHLSINQQTLGSWLVKRVYHTDRFYGSHLTLSGNNFNLWGHCDVGGLADALGVLHVLIWQVCILRSQPRRRFISNIVIAVSGGLRRGCRWSLCRREVIKKPLFLGLSLIETCIELTLKSHWSLS